MSSPHTYASIPIDLIGSFETKWDVENYISEKKAELRRMENEILGYFLMTEPKKFIDDEYDPLSFIQNKFKELFPNEEDDSVWEPGYGMTYWQLSCAQSILNHWDETHHPSGMSYARKLDDFEKDLYCVSDQSQECTKDGIPVDYNGDPITKNSDSYDVRKAFQYTDKLQDGTTKEEFLEHEKRERERMEKEWKEKYGNSSAQ